MALLGIQDVPLGSATQYVDQRPIHQCGSPTVGAAIRRRRSSGALMQRCPSISISRAANTDKCRSKEPMCRLPLHQKISASSMTLLAGPSCPSCFGWIPADACIVLASWPLFMWSILLACAHTGDAGPLMHSVQHA